MSTLRALLLLFLVPSIALFALERDSCGHYLSEDFFLQSEEAAPREEVEAALPYLDLIPKPYQATGWICSQCGQLCEDEGFYFDPSGPSVEEANPISGTPDPSHSGSCYLPSKRYALCLNCWRAWDRKGPLPDKQWCQDKAWFADYFSKMAHADFSNFLDYLEFCQEVPTCKLLWPELGGPASKINDLSYFAMRSLLTLYLLPTFNESWRGYSDHGKAAFAVTYLFFYSHYHSQFTKVASYIDSQAIRGDKASEGLDHLRTAFDRIHPLFIELYSQCLQNHPHPRLWYERGMVYFHMGDTIAALDDYRQLLQSAEERKDERWLTSEMYQKEGRSYAEICSYDASITALTKAIQKDPGNKEAYFDRAVAYFETGQFDKAFDDYLSSGIRDKIRRDWTNSWGANIPATKAGADAFVQGLKRGGTQAAKEFVPALLGTTYGIGTTAMAVAIPLPEFQQPIVETASSLITFLKEHTLKEDFATLVPELADLLLNWSKHSDVERMEKMGYIVGQYGTDIFLTAGAVATLKAARRLRKAVQIANLEACVVSEEVAAAALKESAAHAVRREKYLRGGTLKIEMDKQGKHIVGHQFYEPDLKRSIWTHANPQSLLEEYAGTGVRTGGTIPGQAGFREVVNFGEPVGFYVIRELDQAIETSWGTIHYSKQGAHIVPAKPRMGS